MALLTAQLTSFMDVDSSVNLLEEDQTLVADLITASMDVDSQEKEDPPYVDEIDLADDGFENPFLNFDAEFPTESDIQSLQAEFAQAAGHFVAEAGFGDLAVSEGGVGEFSDADSAGRLDGQVEVIAGFGGFADPAGGLVETGLVEELPVRLRRAEGGRYGFDIVVRDGRAYPAGADLDPLQRAEHPWQGDQIQQQQQQQGEFGVRDQSRGGFGDEFRGVAHRVAAPLVGGDPVERVGERERGPQAMENMPGDNHRTSGGDNDYIYRAYRNSRDQSDRQDDRIQRHHFDDNLAAAAAAAVALAANHVAPSGALPRPPPLPILPAPTTPTEPYTNTSSSVSGHLSSVRSHLSSSLRSRVTSYQSSVSRILRPMSHLSSVSSHLSSVSSHFSPPSLNLQFITSEQLFSAAAGDGFPVDYSMMSMPQMRGEQSYDWGRSHGHVSDAQAFALQTVGRLGAGRPEIDTRDFEQHALGRNGEVGVNAPVTEAMEERTERVVTNLVAHVAAAFDGASSRGDAVYIGGRGQDGLTRQLASFAGSVNGSASSTSLQNSAAQRIKNLLRPKHAGLKRKSITMPATCQLILPSLVAPSASILVC